MTAAADHRRFLRSVGLLAACALGGAAFAGCATAKRPDGGAGLIASGARAPEVEGRDPQGKKVRLSDAHGHPAVVYFYPKDETPGCTKEACGFRDAFDRYQARGITIFGVSRDSEESHDTFRAKHALPFVLVSDTSGTVQQAYGVGSFLGMASRVTFLVDPDGKIARTWPNVDPGTHANEVLAAAETLSQP